MKTVCKRTQVFRDADGLNNFSKKLGVPCVEMNTARRSVLERLLLYAIALLFFTQGQAQTLTTLRCFGNPPYNSGWYPQGLLVAGPDGTLYGTSSFGDSGVSGTVFRVRPDGTGFTVIKWFTNSLEGAMPQAGLVLSANMLYGTTFSGGSFNYGTVFSIDTNGGNFKVLKHFNGSDGANPEVSLAFSGGVLYGTTYSGGSSSFGTVFKLNTDGTGYTILRQFNGGDGANPRGSLALSGNVIYGTTFSGGVSNYGTLFKVNTDGSGYLLLREFVRTDGRNPYGGLNLLDGTLYGTTTLGGSAQVGTVFRVSTDGSGYTVLRSFGQSGLRSPRGELLLADGILYGTTYDSGLNGSIYRISTNGSGFAVLKAFDGTEGRSPFGGLIMLGNTLYGTTYYGGTQNRGTLFHLNTNGTGYAVLKDFGSGDGVNSYAELSLVNGTLYGTTHQGGNWGDGTVFKLNTDGSGYTVLKSFHNTNNEAAFPHGGLVASDQVLYGTTRLGGTNGSGTVFRVKTDGTDYAVLKSFDALDAQRFNSDGAGPWCTLVVEGVVLYGTTFQGGGAGYGTVFKLNVDGSGYTVLKNFAGSDGANPVAGLTLSEGILYGTTRWGGVSGYGSVFRLKTDGTAFTVLKSFSGGGDGQQPFAGVTVHQGVIYGTTYFGGNGNDGTVFKLSLDGSGYGVLRHLSNIGSGPDAPVIVSGNVLYGTTQFGGSSGSGTLFKINVDGSGYRVMKHFVSPNYSPSTGAYTNTSGARPQSGLVLLDDELYGTTPAGGDGGIGTVFKLDLRGINWTSADGLFTLNFADWLYVLENSTDAAGPFAIRWTTTPYFGRTTNNSREFFRLKRIAQ